MKILLVGNGGREHAVAKAFARSSHKPELYVFANKVNPGIRELATDYQVFSNLSDFEAIEENVKVVQPDFAYVGPDNPIVDGLVDHLDSLGVKSVAPCQ